MGRAFSDINFNLSSEQKEILQDAHERAFDTLCDFAISNAVDFILIAGDTFDACEQDLHSRLKLVKAFSKLERNNISVFAVCGNHDPANSYTQDLTFKNSERIHIFGVNTETKKLEVTLPNGEPIANIYPFGFETKEFPCSPCSKLEKATNQKLFNIGLIHCDTSGGDSVYAPCSEKELLELNYDYYALGHIHKPYQNNNIVYSGTPQGRHSKDEGAHGFRYITVENNNIVKNDFITCDKVRYINIEYNITNDESELEVVQNLQHKLTKEAKNCELAIFNLNLNGIRTFAKNDKETLKKELELENIIINEIYDETISNIDTNTIKNSGGILAEILKITETPDTIEEIISQTQKEIGDFIKNTDNIKNEDLLPDTFSNLKNICIEIYGNEE